ncbi:MAG: hypothetical protein JWO90_1849 [Solirubrobacterales bacterium]|jgi:signal transduction histidine kinase|nr:hypothetical protein [Solirubrobacterales bacterium]
MAAARPELPEDPQERLVALVHELRTPLTVVSGFADLLESRGDALSAEQRAEFTARVAAGARELREILDAERGQRHTS